VTSRLARPYEVFLTAVIVSIHVKEESSWVKRVSLNDLVNRALILSRSMMNDFPTDPGSPMWSVNVGKQITILWEGSKVGK